MPQRADSNNTLSQPCDRDGISPVNHGIPHGGRRLTALRSHATVFKISVARQAIVADNHRAQQVSGRQGIPS